ncbi:MAG: hypothetical protein JOY51_07960, partial [Nevskia sp.]|nr:hypothetical protein [Nevskia sp.]
MKMIKIPLNHFLCSSALSRAALAVCLASLAACAATVSPEGLVPGQSDRAQVEARMGKPAEQIKTADGGGTLFYPSGPAGLTTYAVHLRPDGVVDNIAQTLTPENVRMVRSRMGRMRSSDVMALLGPPKKVAHYQLQGTTVW